MTQKIVVMIICLFSLGSAQAMKRAVVLLNKVHKLSAKEENAALRRENSQLRGDISTLKEQEGKHKIFASIVTLQNKNAALRRENKKLIVANKKLQMQNEALNNTLEPFSLVEAFCNAGVGDDD